MGLVELITSWLPLLLFLVLLVFISRKQNDKYGKHVADVTQINQDVLRMNQENNALIREQLDVLKQIKSSLEDRKS